MVLDIPKIYTALAEWSSCFVFFMVCGRKDRKSAVIIVGLLPVLCVLQTIIGVGPLVAWMPGMVFALLLMYGSICFCCDVTYTVAGFYWTVAFIMAEFVAAFEWQIASYLFTIYGSGVILRIACLLLFYLGCFTLLYVIERKWIKKEYMSVIHIRETMTAVVVAFLIFFMSNISYVFSNTPFSVETAKAMFYIRTLVDLMGTIVLFSLQERQRETYLQRELDMRDLLQQKQMEQYEVEKKTIDTLNRKYHDWKHQIIAIRTEPDPKQRDQYLLEMEEEIKMYEAQSRTGNRVLDIIITGKRLYCVQHHIGFNCVIDGALLNSLEPMDICSIFGNAIDNAIEYEEKIEDTEKRLINVAVFSQNNFIMIRVENYCVTSLDLRGELPETTKKDKVYHGYGLKSIRTTAEKYGGGMTLNQEDNWFVIKVMIPQRNTTR